MKPELELIEHQDEHRKKRDHSTDDELDMTPMVDVTFLLLIFFMITAAFALQKSLEVPPAQEDEASNMEVITDPDQDTVTVKIDGDNIFWISAPGWETEKKALSVQDMLSKLREARKSQGKGHGGGIAKMIVQASGEAVHEKVVAAVDGGMTVGMEEIQLMLYEEDDY